KDGGIIVYDDNKTPETPFDDQYIQLRAGDIVVVGEADRGDQAVDMVKRLQPDVLLLDMEMPGKDGLTVAREIQEANLAVRVLALSAHDDEEYIMKLLQGGAAGYLTKEEALDTIVDAVRGVARGEEGWLSRRAAARITTVARKQPDNLVDLTEREEEVVDLLADGLTNNEIADQLSVTERTVRFHLRNIYDKIDVNSRASAISWALKRRQNRS
ncbi:MAG: response regulator transcription factor, partial [Caldilineaceae bacterium]|nr:response regulator transcription factor [Caldilineaceae bacterium]